MLSDPPPTIGRVIDLPVARCALDLPLPHLDRLFDYEVREADDELAVPGSRVRVR